MWADASEGPEADGVFAAEAGPLDDVLAAERRAKVCAGLAQLSEAHRRAISLSFFGGLTHQEIADRLGEPVGTVKTRIRRGLIALRQVLESLPDPVAEGMEP